MKLTAPLVLGALLAVSACNDATRPFAYDPRDLRVLPPPRRALPVSAYRVRWDAHTVPEKVPASTDVDVRLSLSNTSDRVWPDLLAGDPVKRNGGYAVRLAYQWLGAGDDPARWPPLRAELPRPIAPGETISLPVTLKSPPEPGPYQVVFELVQELVTWFRQHGGTRLAIPVTVQ